MAITVLHTADWQIGKRFGEMEGDAGALLRTQRLRTVERLAELARTRAADAVLVAGDVFDANTVSDETLRRTLNATKGFAGPWILLPGNHDAALAESVWSRLARIGPPANVVLATTADPIFLAGGALAVLPAPLQRRHEPLDVTEWFDAAATPSHAARIGLAHGSVANRLPRPSEAPNTIADDRADRARLDYLALGDWHGTLEIAPRTWYAGTPEPDRFRDNNPGNALIVRIEGPGSAPIIEPVPVGHFRWITHGATLMRAEDLTVLDHRLAAEPEPHQLLLDLTLSGVVDLATREQVAATLDRHRATYFFLRVHSEALVGEPSDDDLDRIDTMGFVRAAIDELRRRATDPADSERDVARAALQRLYFEHVRLGG